MKSNLSNRKCLDHNNQQVLLACFNKFCQENRLICKCCLDIHTTHLKDLINDEEIDKKVQISYRQSQQLIKELNYKFDELTELFRILIISIKQKFQISIEKLNQMENWKFNQSLNLLTIQDEQSLKLTQIFDDGCLYLKDKIFSCQIDIDLTKLKYIEIGQMEKAEAFYKQGFDQYQNQDYENAIKYFDFALGLDRNHLRSLHYKGSSLKMQGFYQESLEWFDKVLQIDQNYSDALRGKGDSLRGLEQFKKSMEWYNRALEINPQYKQALRGYGDCLRLMGKYKESIGWYERVLQIDPQCKCALYGKGESLRMLSKYTQAFEFLYSALQIDQNFEPALSSMGACLINLQKFVEAEVCLEEARKLNPNNQWNKNQLYIFSNNFQEILQDISRQ